MAFMQFEITRKGSLYCADCAKCGATLYSHEWAHGYNNDDRDALQDGTYRCGESARYLVDTAPLGSASGYLDCTDWHYGRNKRSLARELRAMYGEG